MIYFRLMVFIISGANLESIFVKVQNSFFGEKMLQFFHFKVLIHVYVLSVVLIFPSV
jgi:hypothetical protein